jgi:NH3-dependent NAD+ synthetase
VDNYGFNNSVPQITTVFFDKKGNSKYAIVLVKWHISALGADTLADYYQIIAYRLAVKGSAPRLIIDEKISAELGQGYDGQEDGQEVRFKWKTADDIKRKFDYL